MQCSNESKARSARRLDGQFLAALYCTLAGCVALDMDPVSSGLPCAAPSTATDTAAAVVWLRTYLGEDAGYRYCSGVAISPSLVVTSQSCVAYPADMDYGVDPAEGGALSTRDLDTHFDPNDHEALCSGGDWLPVEDGSFRVRWGAPVPERAISVGLEGEPDNPSFTVDRLIGVLTGSHCRDGIALLLLAGELDVPNVPIRLDVTADWAGELVLVSGSIGVEGRFQRRDSTALVQAVTFDAPTPELPPRSLLLGADTCAFERGGAVSSLESGALIGIVAWGRPEACEEATSGATVANRLAAFRKVILLAAATYGQTLVSESSGKTAEEVVTCPEPE